MRWIRCNDCGMAIKIKGDEFFVDCPICNKKVSTITAETIKGVDSLYNSSNYCTNCDDEHPYFDERKTYNKKKTYEPKENAEDIMKALFSNNTKKGENEGGAAIGIVIFVIFIIMFILSMM